jgi:hypothetical protein
MKLPWMNTPPVVARISYPAPRRATVELGEKMYSTQPYTLRDVAMTLDSGGWFMKARHEFADSDAETLAFGGTP